MFRLHRGESPRRPGGPFQYQHRRSYGRRLRVDICARLVGLAFTSGPIVCSSSFRYRTPLCILYPPQIIATACFVLAQYLAEGPNSLPLEARISFSAPSASLPTPPSHKASSPDASRLAIEFFALSESDVQDVASTSAAC